MRYNFEYFRGKSFIRTNLQVTEKETTAAINRAHHTHTHYVMFALQSTIAVSKLVSTLIGQSDANLRRSLTTIATLVSQDTKVKVQHIIPSDIKITMLLCLLVCLFACLHICLFALQNSSFPSEVKELMVRLKTVLSSTAQMMVKDHSTHNYHSQRPGGGQ